MYDMKSTKNQFENSRSFQDHYKILQVQIHYKATLLIIFQSNTTAINDLFLNLKETYNGMLTVLFYVIGKRCLAKKMLFYPHTFGQFLL